MKDANGKDLEVKSMTEEECEQILQVVQRDFELRQREKERLAKFEVVLRNEDTEKQVLIKQKHFSENFCIQCCHPFGILFNRKKLCPVCGCNVCKSCSQYDFSSRSYICHTCLKKEDLKLMSFDWFYTSVSKRFKRFGSAKVVRLLYKRKKHADTLIQSDSEIDSGFSPSLSNSLEGGRKFRLPLHGLFQTIGNGSTDKLEIENVNRSYHRLGQNSNLHRSSSLEVLPQSKLPRASSLEVLHKYPVTTKTLGTKDIYKEAFENTRQIEGQKFRLKFDGLLIDLQQALENQIPNGVSTTHSASYGEILVNYQNRIRELLSSVSQCLHLALENYVDTDESVTATSQKIKQIVSQLVEDRLGESVDLTSDEAVSDLSSLSDEFSDHHTAFEDQLAQAVVAKVLETHRRQENEPGQEQFQGIELDSSSELHKKQVKTTLEELKCFSRSLQGRKPLQCKDINEQLGPPEEPLIEKVTVEPRNTKKRGSHQGLPNLDEIDFNSKEIDPDLVSLNLAPITEVDEDTEDAASDIYRTQIPQWRENWIVTGMPPAFSNINTIKSIQDLSQPHYMLVPQPEQEFGPQIGNRDADELSDLSENESLNSFSDNDNAPKFVKETSNTLQENFKDISESSIQINKPEVLLRDSHRNDNERIFPMSTQESKKAEERYHSLKIVPLKKSQTLTEELIASEQDDPTFLLPPESSTVIEGEPVKWICNVAGTEPIDVFWFRIQDTVTELYDCEKYDLSVENNSHTLVMHYPKKCDSGQYMCIAVNECGKCSQYFILNIKGNVKFSSTFLFTFVTGKAVTVSKNTQTLKKPEFLKEIGDVEVPEGQAVKFRCKVKGYPQPRISWYKDGKLLKKDNTYKVEKFGNRDYLLTMDYATMNDDAEYTVVAKNIAGEVKSVAQLIIEPQQQDTITSTSAKSYPNIKMDKKLQQQLFIQSEDKKSTATLQKKEEQHLQNISRKMTMTKDNVSVVAEDMLQTVDELSIIQQHLDYMDKTLNKIENNMYKSDSGDDDDSINNNDNTVDDMFAHRVLAEYSTMKTAAENVRKVTSTAMDIIHTAEDAIEAEKDVQNNVVPQRTVGMLKHMTSSQPAELVPSDCQNAPPAISDAAEASHITNRNQNQTYKAQAFDWGSWKHTQSKHVLTEQQSISDESKLLAATVLNLGPSCKNSQQYSRDSYANTSVALNRKGCANKLYMDSSNKKTLEETEDKIYMTAGKVFGLEDRIQQLESQVETMGDDTPTQQMSNLEDEVAVAVAQVEQREKEVRSIEDKISSLNHKSDHTNRVSSARQSQDFGIPAWKEPWNQNDIPDSREEFDSDSGVELPSVNRLKAKFNQTKMDKSQDTLLKRPKDPAVIYSITARSLPKRQVESLRDDQQEGNSDTKNRQTDLESRFIGYNNHSLKTDPAPEPPAAVPGEQQRNIIAGYKHNFTRSHEKRVNSETFNPRIRRGCIAERTSFWERKIKTGNSSDITVTDDDVEEFPEMIQNPKEF